MSGSEQNYFTKDMNPDPNVELLFIWGTFRNKHVQIWHAYTKTSYLGLLYCYGFLIWKFGANHKIKENLS